MTWISHKIISVSIVYGITGNTLSIIPVLVGSVFPDFIEYLSYRKWNENHRKTSHWFVLYLVPLMFALPFHNSVTGHAFLFFLMGCLLHILEDAITGTIPAMALHRKVGIRLISNGSCGEFFITMATVFILAAKYVLI